MWWLMHAKQILVRFRCPVELRSGNYYQFSQSKPQYYFQHMSIRGKCSFTDFLHLKRDPQWTYLETDHLRLHELENVIQGKWNILAPTVLLTLIKSKVRIYCFGFGTK